MDSNWIKKPITKKVDLPFEEGKEYKTKFQSGETVLLTKIDKNIDPKTKDIKSILYYGIYQRYQHLGVCLISIDRLIPDTTLVDDFIEICGCCNTPKIKK